MAGLGAGQQDAVEQRFRLLRRVHLLAGLVLEAFVAGAQRNGPVRAHLGVFVESLQRVVIEGVALLSAGLGGPDQGLVGIAEARALEVRHRVRLAPDDVVHHPEAHVLHGDAEAEDVVIGADDPDGAIVLQHAPAFLHPGAGELVVGFETGELVPLVIDRVDLGIVRAQQVAAQLQVVGRIGENQVDGSVRQRLQHVDALTDMDGVELQRRGGEGGEGGFELRHGTLSQQTRAAFCRRV